MNKLCVIVPIYNKIPSEDEMLSIERNLSVLKGYDTFAVCPESMDVSAYKSYFDSFVSFSDKYFRSNKSYSRLILSKDFYKPFMNYEYMLIAQTDTVILNTKYSIDFFIDKGYDYWGAPWPEGPFEGRKGLRESVKSIFIHNPETLTVGNGGFSLRHVRNSYELVKKHNFYINTLYRLNEDMFFSDCARKKDKLVYKEYTESLEKSDCVTHTNIYTAATVEEASQFALEVNMKEEIEKGNIPYAVHAWKKYLKKDIKEILKDYE